MDKIEDITEDKKSKMTNGLFSSRTEEWETPQNIFRLINQEFNFTLDVCATKQNAKCVQHYTKEDDGLAQPWGLNICWMNPPYGKKIGDWMLKALHESERGATVVCLVHSRTDTKWFHNYAMKSDEIRFIKGRLKFGDGKEKAPFPSCLVIFRPFTETKSLYNSPLISSMGIK